MEILHALKSLDPEDPKHWSTMGLPRVDVVSKILGQKVKRGAIADAAPNFTRENREIPAPETTQESDEPVIAVVEPAITKPVPSEFETVRKALSNATAARDDANRALKVAQEQMDIITQADERNRDPHENQRNIQAYLETQKKLRVEKAARRAQVLGLGLRPSDLMPGAPIDQAMARRKPVNRPKFPVNGSAE